MIRDRQLALIEGREYSMGPLPLSVVVGSNADLIASVAPLYLSGSVLDVTYGKGGWWRRWRPEPFTFHDLKLDGVDFRELPHVDRAFDAVCFDPPYLPRQGPNISARDREKRFRESYGLDISRGGRETRELILAGLRECARVSDRWVLVKCCDYVNGRRFQLGHQAVLDEARDLGLAIHDLLIHASGPGPGGGQIQEPLRARRAHSYLVVLRRPKARASRDGLSRKRVAGFQARASDQSIVAESAESQASPRQRL